jgi:hypothetical protein
VSKKCIAAICLAAALSALAHRVFAAEPDIGTVSGTVIDETGGIVPGAIVTLKCFVQCDNRSTVASDMGAFEFHKLALSVPYQITVTANGFNDWTSPSILLTTDQPAMLLTDVRIRIADGSSSVTVYASQEEIATEQVRIEEQQRILGIVPNFYVVYDARDAVPLSTKLKFKLAMRVAVDPVTIIGVGLLAGIQQAGDTPDYVQGAKGFGQRLGANAAGGLSDIMIGGAVLPSLLHQDPRYFYQGAGTTRSRLFHALASPFICRGDNGRGQPNYSSLGGDLASSALQQTYLPQSNRGAGTVFGGFAVGTAERELSTVLQEFVLHRLTPRAKKGR